MTAWTLSRGVELLWMNCKCLPEPALSLHSCGCISDVA